ncbi:MAG: sensor histidine kinase [Alicyclobacillus sp.]|nr:sensor histidine kinase [Alicyclobacillus sp.]
MPVFDLTDQGIRLLEEERRRIARDLHDGPAQTLTNLSMRLEVVQRMFQTHPEWVAAELERLNAHARTAVNEIRRLIYDLRPVAIDEVGLLQAVAELCNRCSREWDLPFEFTVAEGVHTDFSPAKQVAVYRLIQEIFHNIRKHAAAQRVQVRFSRTGCLLDVWVEDDGVGFDPSAVPVGHYGIIGMKERAAFLDGNLEIQSAPGRGSRFHLAVPVYPES